MRRNFKEVNILKFAIYTLGCKVNQADSQSIQELLVQAGYQMVAIDEIADIYIINTCVVTNVGQQKSRQSIRKFIRENPQAIIVVSGCYPQTSIQEVEGIPGVALIIGNQERQRIVELLAEYQAKRQPKIQPAQLNIVSDINDTKIFEEIPTGTHTDKTRAFLKIQEGCNQFCTYCIIPYARGRLRSRNLESIRKEIETLVANNYKEVVLLGIHLGAYGKDLASGISLVSAVKTALSVPGLVRLRLGSLECIEIEDELLELLAAEPRLAKHLHLPLQAGTDQILARMNRPYTTVEFKTLIKKIRSKVPGISITTDVIVGFPGETETLFQETCTFVEALDFAKINIFPFSKRKNTPAEKYSLQIAKEEKQKRVKQLEFIDKNSQKKFLTNSLEHNQQVLFEHSRDAFAHGYTSNYIRIYVANEQRQLTNEVHSVVTKEIFKDGLLAVLV